MNVTLNERDRRLRLGCTSLGGGQHRIRRIDAHGREPGQGDRHGDLSGAAGELQHGACLLTGQVQIERQVRTDLPELVVQIGMIV
jgi:hypothetical protein